MIIRADGDAVVLIGQPAHAWISGQLAAAWGAPQFGVPAPREEVLLGALQHDIGMAAWDAAPDRDPRTGLPYSFLEMPLETHVRLWSNAGRLALGQSRYAALLVSLHGTTLYARRNLDELPAEQAALVRGYLRRAHAFQDDLRASLRADPRYAEHAADAAVDRNRRLVFAWDWMSLVLCLDREDARVPDVPTAGGDAVTLTMRRAKRPDAGAPIPVAVDPWPFAASAVEVRCEGRRLDGAPYPDPAALHDAMARAPWVELAFALASE